MTQPVDKSSTMIGKELTKAQVAFLAYCKTFGWGKLEVTVKNGEPVMLRAIQQDIKLD